LRALGLISLTRLLRTGLLLAACLLLPRCIERRLLVRTEPPGARVFLDGALRGTSPIEIPFSAYGTRELTVRRPGFRALRRRISVAPPWYTLPGLDLITELLWPLTIEDRREVLVSWSGASSDPLPPLAAPQTLAERATEARARLAVEEASRRSRSGLSQPE